MDKRLAHDYRRTGGRWTWKDRMAIIGGIVGILGGRCGDLGRWFCYCRSFFPPEFCSLTRVSLLPLFAGHCLDSGHVASSNLPTHGLFQMREWLGSCYSIS
jgi:hypothetical protein